MRGRIFVQIFQMLLLAASVSAESSANSGAKLNPPANFVSENGNRVLTVEWKDFGRAQITVRSTWSPGSYNLWHGEGRQKEKGIVFSKVVEDGEDKGLEYLAVVSNSKVTVKINFNQGKSPTGEFSGVYRHLSEEKVAALAKKDSIAAEKKLEDEIKLAAKNAAPSDKPAISEWKRRWPELRKKLAAMKSKAVSATPSPEKPALGQSKTVATDMSAADWLALAEANASGANFISQKVPKETKTGWDGDYEDGFGGTVNLKTKESGELEFSFRCTRTPESEEVYYAGVCPPSSVKAKTGTQEATADFTDSKDVVDGSSQKTSVHFRQIGHYLVVQVEYPRSFMSRGWVDGVYLKRPPPIER